MLVFGPDFLCNSFLRYFCYAIIALIQVDCVVLFDLVCCLNSLHGLQVNNIDY